MDKIISIQSNLSFFKTQIKLIIKDNEKVL